MENHKSVKPEIALIIDENKLNYPDFPPFSPHEKYPEYTLSSISEKSNYVYESVRKMFFLMGYDKENFGKSTWNPLRKYISHGQTVVIKPNWVMDTTPNRNYEKLISHPSLIRAVIDYVLIALKGKGKIIVGDAPIQSANFTKLINDVNVQQLISFLNDNSEVEIRVEDFRRQISIRKDNVIVERTNRNSHSFIKINLRGQSMLHPLRNQYMDFRVTNYDKDKMKKYHNLHDHIYVIHKSIIEADTVISIPKLKTHRKAGLTCCLKNSVGINCQKDCLPHHRKRSLEEGGDAYKNKCFLKALKENLYELYDRSNSMKIQKYLFYIIRIINKVIKMMSMPDDFEGSWYGNDTIWRTILDINKILHYSDKSGNIREKKQRNLLFLVDGLIAGEGEGPLKPIKRKLGLLSLGENPLINDLVISKLLGFDYKKIPTLFFALKNPSLWPSERNIDTILVRLNDEKDLFFNELNLNLKFKPCHFWENHIEL